VVAHNRNTLEIYNPDTGRRVAQLSLKTKYFEGFAFTPDGAHLIAVGNEKTAKIYDTDTWAERQTLDWGIGPLKSVAVSPDGHRAAAGSGSGTYSGKIVIWDLI
jgi:WD40 repeat protein